uniref:Baseplate wedge subunit n=1 Tax=Ochrobactrum phage ORM_20 TaxID=2985243 RepID=A0A9N6WUV2_9VIRU|nr:baseplate wedge subunit [Ochrobactrum phage ORM_20]
MAAKIHLEVTKDDYGFLIEGRRNYNFESGVEYFLSAEFPLWATWGSDHIYLKEEYGTTDVINVYNLTCPDHHRYNNDAQLYHIWLNRLNELAGTPIGLIGKNVDDIIPETLPNTVIGEGDNWSGVIQEYKRYLTNNTFEELFNLEQVEYKTPEVVEYLNTPGVIRPYKFTNSERYLAVIVNGEKMHPSDYSPEFLPGSDTHKIFLKNKVSGSIITKTDLCHNVYENGTNRIRLFIRTGDERTFYLSNALKSCDKIFTGKGIPAYENRIKIRSQFDSYVLEQYPMLFDFLQSYYDLEGFSGTAQSYLRNFIDYNDVDKMPDEELARKIRRVFTPSPASESDPRLLVKRLVDFFQNKGNLPSYKWLSNVLFQKDSELHRFSKEVMKLSNAEWHSRTRITLTEEDIKNLRTPIARRSIGVTDEAEDLEIAMGLIGHMIEGRTSTAVAVVEDVTVETYQRKPIYHVYITIQSGEFDQSEPIDIRQISAQVTINSVSYNSQEMGVIGFELKDGGVGYTPGQQILIDSTTGDGFDAYISRVGAKGEAKEIIINSPGWYFRPWEINKVTVESDYPSNSKPFDLSKISNEIVEYQSGYLGYTTVNGELLGLSQAEGGGIAVGKRYVINKEGLLYPNIFASGIIRSSLYFFGITLDSKRLAIVNTRDEIKYFDYVFDGNIVNVFSNGRTLFVLGQRTLYSFDMGKMLDQITPEPTTFVLNPLVSGTTRTIFMLGTSIFGFSETSIVEFDLNGYEKAVYPFPHPIEFSSYERKGDLYNLYMGSNTGDIYVYQWYDGTPRLKAKPIYGRIDAIKKLKNGIMDTLSSYSVLNDNNVYQDLSVGIVLDEFTNTYMKTYDEMINAAGFKHYGIVKRSLNDLDTGGVTVRSEFPEEYDHITGKITDTSWEILETLNDLEGYNQIIGKVREKNGN